jgi:ketosteroid isomerase-like protein
MTDLSELPGRLAALEARVQVLEDELAVTRTIVAYGFAVDTGDASATGALFTDAAVFDVDESFVMRGRSEVEAMVLDERGHQRLLPDCAHTIGPAVVRVEGDRATAVGYSRIYVRRDDGIELFRVGCNRWDLVRGDTGWQIERRTTRALGRAEAQAVLAQGLALR